MDLKWQQLPLVMLARYKAVLIVHAGTMALTLAACLLLPARYSATASVVLDSKPDPISSVMMQSGLVPAVNLNAVTEGEIIASERVARRVVGLLKLDHDEKVKEEWLAATDGKGRLDVWLGALL